MTMSRIRRHKDALEYLQATTCCATLPEEDFSVYIQDCDILEALDRFLEEKLDVQTLLVNTRQYKILEGLVRTNKVSYAGSYLKYRHMSGDVLIAWDGWTV